MANTTTAGRTKFCGKIFLEKDWGPGKYNCEEVHSSNTRQGYLFAKRLARQGGLWVFGLAVETVSYDARNIFNACHGGFRRFFGGPLHHGLQGDVGIAAAETQQHVLGHRLGQSTAFLLDTAADSILQLGYLCPGRIKERDHDAAF
jgi:hypothetical protein